MDRETKTENRPASYDAILKAAVAEFAEHGRDGVRMEKVAVRAGLNKSLVYRHFENREKLFEAAMRSVFAERFELLEGLPADLAELFDRWIERFTEQPQFIQMLLREALEARDGPPIHGELRRRYYRQQVETIKELQQRGQLSNDVDGAFLFLMLTSVLVFPFLLPQVATLVTGKDPDSPVFKRGWKKVLRLLTARLGEE